MQRFFDILFAGLALLVASPLLLPLMLALRLTGEGEIFFTQQRVGRGGGMFGLHKFATMLKNSPSSGTVTMKNDPRILPLGGFLRRTKINELPQLLNVISGDMSLIGPRPQTRRCFDAFPAASQPILVCVRPGLSGIGSIVFRSEQEMMDNADDADRLYDHAIMPYKARLEEWYVAHHGVATYFKLILLTILVVLRPSRGLVWRWFPELPKPQGEIAMLLEQAEV